MTSRKYILFILATVMYLLSCNDMCAQVNPYKKLKSECQQIILEQHDFAVLGRAAFAYPPDSVKTIRIRKKGKSHYPFPPSQWK